jgi:hypothetical protein
MDSRISEYREAAKAMQSGDFQVGFDAAEDGADDLSHLGEALSALARTLDGRFSELRRLTKIAGRSDHATLLDDVLGHVYDTLRPTVPYDRIGFSLVEDDPELGLVAHSRWLRSDFPEVGLPMGYAAPLEGSSLKTVADLGAPRVINDLEAYLEARPDSDSTQRIVREGVRSNLTCPLLVGGRPIGFLFLSSREKYRYDDGHIDICEQLAGTLATLVDRSRLYDDLRQLRERHEAALADTRSATGHLDAARAALRVALAGNSLDTTARASLERALEALELGTRALAVGPGAN